MTALILSSVLTVVAVVSALALVIALRRTRDGAVTWLDELTLDTVVVQIDGGDSIRGVLVGVYADCVVLRGASLLSANVTTPIDGDVVIARGKLKWLQRIMEAA